jgi:hypothetical protein
MTFKHGKLDDSATMRSLIKVAHEKGLIKDEPVLTKTASLQKKADYSPSSNLMENIIKLCTGLRGMGLDKFANDLESKFMEYKRANSLYETSKETGDDVVDQAHPQGSHKISDVEGDAVVETILDQHLKMINVVNKKPTGKLASNLDILKAVKKAVGQQPSKEDLIRSLQSNAAGVLKAYNNVSALTRIGSDLPQQLAEEAATLNSSNLSFDILNSLYSKVEGIRSALKPGLLNVVNDLLNVGITKADWLQIEGKLNGVQSAIYKLQEILKNPPKIVAPAENDFVKEYNKTVSTLNLWFNIVENDPTNDPESKTEAKKWIQSRLAALQSIKNGYDKSDGSPESTIEYVRQLLKLKNNPNDNFDKFKQAWID